MQHVAVVVAAAASAVVAVAEVSEVVGAAFGVAVDVFSVRGAA
jgi:hypothetical protein